MKLRGKNKQLVRKIMLGAATVLNAQGAYYAGLASYRNRSLPLLGVCISLAFGAKELANRTLESSEEEPVSE